MGIKRHCSVVWFKSTAKVLNVSKAAWLVIDKRSRLNSVWLTNYFVCCSYKYASIENVTVTAHGCASDFSVSGISCGKFNHIIFYPKEINYFNVTIKPQQLVYTAQCSSATQSSFRLSQVHLGLLWFSVWKLMNSLLN
jgi:hypothetical protein